MATTFGDLKTAVQALSVSSDATNAGVYINDGYIDVCARAALGETNATKNLVANQTKYSLTSDFTLTGVLAINELRYIQSGATSNFAIVPAASLREVLDLNSAAVTGFTRAYAFQGADTLQIAPAPSAGDTITIFYVPSPTALSAAGDVPSVIPSQWQERLLTSYGTSRLAEVESPDLAETYRQKYEGFLGQFQMWMMQRQGNTARGMIIGYPNRPNQPIHDRSTYFSGMR
jgi:hypothetical protein